MAKCRIKGCTGIAAIAKTPDMVGLCTQHQQTQSARWAQNAAMPKSFDDVWRGHEQGLKDWQSDVGRMSEAVVDDLLGDEDMAGDVISGAMNDPYQKAMVAYSSHGEVKPHSARFAWEHVLRALGYVDSGSMKEFAHNLGRAQAECKALTPTPKSVNDYLMYVIEPACRQFSLSPEDRKAIERLWKAVVLR